jgi:putative tryptophan/tyrosine transport system substrate-binding protein
VATSSPTRRLGSAATVWPLAARAQQPNRVRRIGVLMNVAKDDPSGQAEIAAFRQGLAEHGWIEGRTIRIEVRWPGGNIELVEALAKELVGLKPDVLLSRTTPATAALKSGSGVIPTVFVGVVEPVEQGFVQSLARPGGYLTGFTNFEVSTGSKMVQLLKEIDPRIVRVAVIYNPQTAPYAGLYVRSMDSAVLRLGVEAVTMPVQSEADIEAAMTAFARQPGGGLVAIPDSFTGAHRDLIIELAARNRLPALYGSPSFMPSGGLMGYAVDTRDLMHRAADYVDRIIGGAKPAELPVQQPTRYNLVINRKVADALGLEIPETLLAIADKVIE